VAGIPPSKVAHSAGEARVTDVDDLGKMGLARRLALIASLLHAAQVRARDEVATMFCKRMATITKKAKERLEALRERHRADTERLLGVFGDVLGAAGEGLSLAEGERAGGQPSDAAGVVEGGQHQPSGSAGGRAEKDLPRAGTSPRGRPNRVAVWVPAAADPL
jgi:hypothetical protein